MITVLQLYLNGLVGTHTYRLLPLPLSMHACMCTNSIHTKNLFLQGHVCTDELRPIKAKQLGLQFIDQLKSYAVTHLDVITATPGMMFD